VTTPVLLVGAGPGDPELLTVRAARALAEADVVLYDALVDPRVLALATRAMCLPVGKRGGQPSMDQRAIEAVMIRAARGGRRVVRLKAGDPFVFGRGGEEALALAEAGLRFEVVPGVSSAVAGPAAANIPVTHRGVAGGFAVLTARPAAAWHATVDHLPPGTLTLVFMMALAARAEIAARLLERGWPASTSVAIVLGAHTARQWSWTGALRELGAAALPADRADLPGLLVVGEVVDVSARLAALALEEDDLATA
jgi:uroporphyrin-III C-methyltransferase / precorrin-2 dehydrogenase / sirohydrochlorin ferrochelatase